MFRGDETIRFKPSGPKDQIRAKIESALSPIGTVNVNNFGDIAIQPRKSLENFLTKTNLRGDVRELTGEYTVTVEYDCTLSGWGWAILIVAILIYLLGLLVLLGPLLKRNHVSQVVRCSLRSIPETGTIF